MLRYWFIGRHFWGEIHFNLSDLLHVSCKEMKREHRKSNRTHHKLPKAFLFCVDIISIWCKATSRTAITATNEKKKSNSSSAALHIYFRHYSCVACTSKSFSTPKCMCARIEPIKTATPGRIIIITPKMPQFTSLNWNSLIFISSLIFALDYIVFNVFCFIFFFFVVVFGFVFSLFVFSTVRNHLMNTHKFNAKKYELKISK